MSKIIGLKEFRENVSEIEKKVREGQSFLVVKRSKPIFRISPLDRENELWEEVIDFTKIKKGGVKIEELLSRL